MCCCSAVTGCNEVQQKDSLEFSANAVINSPLQQPATDWKTHPQATKQPLQQPCIGQASLPGLDGLAPVAPCGPLWPPLAPSTPLWPPLPRPPSQAPGPL